MIKEILQLSIATATLEFKLKNEGSFLGILWYLLNPILMFVLLLLVFGDRLGQDIPHYPLYLLLGIIMFNFFRQTTVESSKTISDNKSILKSINFPREALVFSIVLKSFFSHIFEILAFSALLIFFNVPITGIIFYLAILVFFCFFIFGISLLLSAVTVYFLDLDNIWKFVSHLLWFATPIFYTIGGQTRLFAANLFNPMYYFITIARDLVIYTRMPEWWMIGGMLAHTLISVALGLVVFNKLKNKFTEMI